jgi:hypothetical protein
MEEVLPFLMGCVRTKHQIPSTKLQRSSTSKPGARAWVPSGGTLRFWGLELLRGIWLSALRMDLAIFRQALTKPFTAAVERRTD